MTRGGTTKALIAQKRQDVKMAMEKLRRRGITPTSRRVYEILKDQDGWVGYKSSKHGVRAVRNIMKELEGENSPLSLLSNALVLHSGSLEQGKGADARSGIHSSPRRSSPKQSG